MPTSNLLHTETVVHKRITLSDSKHQNPRSVDLNLRHTIQHTHIKQTMELNVTQQNPHPHPYLPATAGTQLQATNKCLQVTPHVSQHKPNTPAQNATLYQHWQQQHTKHACSSKLTTACLVACGIDSPRQLQLSAYSRCRAGNCCTHVTPALTSTSLSVSQKSRPPAALFPHTP